jgi:hypothetical protein
MSQAASLKPIVAVGVSVASLAYAGSLAVQRAVPALGEALTLTIGEGVRATYYLRVCMSLALGGAVAALAPRVAFPERWLAWGTAVAVGVSVVLICAFP